MAWSLILGILDSNPSNKVQNDNQNLNVAMTTLNEDFLAFRYRDWLDSKPFDIGNMCESSLNQLQKPMRDIRDGFHLVEREARAYDVK